MVKKLSCMCGASLAEYVDTGNRYERFLRNISLRENISCISKTTLSIIMQSCASIVKLVAHNLH